MRIVSREESQWTHSPTLLKIIFWRLRRDRRGVPRITLRATSVRKAAAYGLGNSAKKLDAKAIAALSVRLEEKGLQVWRAAAQALKNIVQDRAAHAIAVASAFLNHADSSVRRSAAYPLKNIAERGDAVEIAAVSGRLEDKDFQGRRVAAHELAFRSSKQEAECSILEFSSL